MLSTKTLTDEEILKDLRRCNNEFDGPLTRSRYTDVGVLHGSTVQRRFGSWSDAKQAAGIEASPDNGGMLSVDYDDLNPEKRSKRLRMIKGHYGCKICNRKPHPIALDFHHINPSTKSEQVSRMAWDGSQWEEIIEEIQKCIIVCATCHREIEAGYTEIPEA